MSRWNKSQRSEDGKDEGERIIADVNGFGSISRRSSSSKPMIAAVNGGAYGGGVEIVVNCDLVVASEEATFALPEVKRGVVAIQGGLYSMCCMWSPCLTLESFPGMPRLARISGHQVCVLTR